MFKFIHAADLHLDSPLRGLERYEGAPVDEIRSATRRALENMVNLAIEQRVDFVLIAGDVYDGDWKDHNTGLFFVGQMSRLRAEAIPVIMIAGNHDAANKMTRSLRLPDNVEMLSSRRPATAQSPRLAELGVAVHGQSFANSSVTDNIASNYPEKTPGAYNIGLLHTALEGADGHETYAPCKLNDLRQKQYDYWALGHVHQQTIVCQDPLVVYSGNTQGRHIRETGAKGCYLVTIDNAGQASLNFRPLDVLRWESPQLDVHGISHPAELSTIFAGALAELQRRHGDLPLAIRVTIIGRTDCHDSFAANPVHWTNELRAKAMDVSGGSVWIEQVKFRTSPAVPITPESMGDGPLGELLRYLDDLRDNETELRELADELADFQVKLPSELTMDGTGLRFDDPDRMRQWIDEVQPMLLRRLAEGKR